jgi:hypothetical protein
MKRSRFAARATSSAAILREGAPARALAPLSALLGVAASEAAASASASAASSDASDAPSSTEHAAAEPMPKPRRRRGAKFKAIAAAESLRRISPHVTAEGVVLTIPMPGHPLPAEGPALAKVRESVARLEALINAHDVVYLLTDTRESRWLPTLLCAARSDTTKLTLNAALGFDTCVNVV